ncbi:uracil-DNA glycosylase [Roseovarius sp. E0-M6]|uniref:uracil-DNA glycosylase n=1 Tax=Roseovarius sp. E0-M6 TaxID=3127118 RepID=UPI0030103EDF
MDLQLDHHTAKALLDWQIEMGATEAIGDAPIDRYELAVAAAKPAPIEAPTDPVPTGDDADPIAEARAAAAKADDLGGLKAAMAAFEHCDLKLGARQLVFSDGHPAARMMIVGEAPGRDEDRVGKPFVGRAGQLLDRMLGAIGLDRASDDPSKAVYITNVLSWRPPQNRDPSPEEIAMLLPFVARHVELVNPDILVLMGNISCQAGLGRRGITRLRGTWTEAYGKPALPMFHPAYLLRQPTAKRAAWADLLSLQARLRG